MDNNEKRKQDEELVAAANAYLEKLGLSVNMQTFFTNDHVQNFMHTAYAEYEAKVENVVKQLPPSMKEKANKVKAVFTGREDTFIADVLDSFKVNLTQVFIYMETYVPMDSLVGNLFATAFVSEADGKMFEVVKGITNQMLTMFMANYIRNACLPEDIPDEEAMILAMMADGQAMIPLSELMEDEWEEDDDDWDDEDDCEEDSEDEQEY